jgi:hypothetical protein
MTTRTRALKRLLLIPIATPVVLVLVFFLFAVQGGLCAFVQLITGYPLSDQFGSGLKKIIGIGEKQ